MKYEKNFFAFLRKVKITSYLFYNYISKNVQRTGNGKIYPYKRAVFDLAKGSKIILGEEDFIVNNNKPKGAKAEAYVKLQEDATLVITGKVTLNYNGTIEIHKGAAIEIGSGYINSGTVILAKNKIKIGKNQLISRGCYIYDDDHHDIIDEYGKKLNTPKEVIIEDNVWIGLNSKILRGSVIGEGAMISAGSVVGGKIKAHTMALGNPARSYSEVKWRE